MSNSDPPKRHRCKVTGLADLTHDVRLVRLALDSGEPLQFRAGQFVRLAFADFPFTDYSIANKPGEDQLEFLIRDAKRPGVSQYATRSLALGEIVDLWGPYGDCFLREEHGGPILAMAGGSGLAPVRSIVEAALARDVDRPVHLYFGVRSERDLFLLDRFRTLADADPRLCFVPVIEETAQAGYRRGLLTDAVAEDFQDLDGFKAYLAGPPAMVEASMELLLTRGLSSDDIHADAYHGTATQYREDSKS